MSLDLRTSFKTSIDRRVKSLVLYVDYLENWYLNFIQKKCWGKDVFSAHTFCSLDCNFSFCMDFLHCWLLLNVKKIKLSSCILNSLYHFLIFWLIGLSFKTQFKILSFKTQFEWTPAIKSIFQFIGKREF